MTRSRALVAGMLLGAVLVMMPAAAHAAPQKARVRDYFSEEDLARSRRYRTPAYVLSFASLGAEIAILLVIGLAAGTRRLGEIAERAAGSKWWLQALVLAALVTVVLKVVNLPLVAAREALDRSWGLSTRNAFGLLSDIAKGLVFEIVLAAVVALAFFALVRWLPRGWPLAAGAGAVVLTVVLSMIWPLVYEPLFNRFTPVEPALRERVVELGTHAGVRVGDVLVADASRRTTRQNAYVSGLGSTKRVVLYDTLLQQSTPDQVDLVVAHELAHVAHNDVVKGTMLGSIGAVALVALLWFLLGNSRITAHLGIAGPGDPKALPFAALVIVVTGLLALPVANWYSRRVEASADRTAIRLTRDADTAIDVEVSLARSNLSDLTPNRVIRFWFYTHPPVMERIQIALDEKDEL